jgi:hypothetical protein
MGTAKLLAGNRKGNTIKMIQQCPSQYGDAEMDVK